VKNPAQGTWALILAGGDGMRLRPLTRQIAGDERPKQFCPFLDGETLLDRTRRRVDLFVRPDRQVVVVSQPHEQYYRELAGDLAPGRLAVQPSNRGTAAGMLCGLVRIASLAGAVPVAVFPCDHYISDDRAFGRSVEHALGLVHARRDLVVVLGIEPTHAETQYGWIEPGGECARASDGAVAFAVRRFWEKPARAQAQMLLRSGALWNSFVMVGWVDAFLALVAEALPGLVAAFAPVLVTWHGVGAMKALFFSITACLYNWRAFAVYALAALLAFVAVFALLSLASGLLVAAAGAPRDTTLVVILPAFAIFVSALIASAYASYCDVFDTGTAAKSPTIPV